MRVAVGMQLFALAFALVLPGQTAAQPPLQGAADGARKPAFVVVQSTEGKPLAGVEVACASAAEPDPWLAPPDVVRATTDARGRAVVQLRQCEPYDVVALGPQGADGACDASAFAHDCTCGSTLQLLLDRRAMARAVTVGAGGELAPARLRWRSADSAHGGEVAIVGCSAPLPAVPGKVEFVLLDAAGEPLCLGTAAEIAVTAIAAPAARHVACEVVDDADKPVAGAAIWQRVDTEADVWRPCGTTDAAGRLEAIAVKTGFPPDTVGCLFAARKAGCRESLTGYERGTPFVDGVRQRDRLVEPLHFVLRPGATLAGRVLRGGAAVAGLRLSLQVTQWLPFGGNSGTNLFRTFHATTSADGSYCFPSLPELDKPRLLRTAPFARDGGPAGASARLSLAVAAARTTADLDLARVQTLALQVVDAKNEPAARAGALLLPMGGDEPVHELLSWTPLDAVGRADLCVLPGRWFLFVTDDESSAAEVLEVGGDEPRRTHEVRLQPLPRMRVTVTKADGTPATGVRFRLNGWGTSNAGLSPVERCLATLLDDLDQRFLQRPRAAADGSFVLHFVLPPGGMGLASASTGKTSSREFNLRPDGELELRLK